MRSESIEPLSRTTALMLVITALAFITKELATQLMERITRIWSSK